MSYTAVALHLMEVSDQVHVRESLHGPKRIGGYPTDSSRVFLDVEKERLSRRWRAWSCSWSRRLAVAVADAS